MKQSWLLLLTLFYISSEVSSWRIFRNGRMVGGNLGEPKCNCKESSINEVQEEWFTQNLDHFNPTDETTWKQRFYSNDQFFDPKNGGPVFLMIGGEGEASIKWMTQGAWVNYAEKFGALMFQLEHRYYGKSHPTDDLSTQNLKYLTSQQALADLATFITAMNEKYILPPDVKWIAFGGSYPGSLAAWLRFKYPHLVHGAMSASGPLLAQVDFKDYFRVIKESLATHSDDCVTAVQQGVDQIGVLLKQEIGQANLNELFKLCDPVQNSINNEKDISNLYETIADDFAGVVQYNKDNRVGSPAGANITIDVVCDIMVNQTIGPPVNRLAKVNEVLLSAYDQKCLDYNYDKMINNLRNVSWDSEASTKMKVFVCLAVFALVAAAQAETAKEKLRKYSDECKSVSGVSEELLNKVRNHEDVHDPKLDEHGFCILKKAGFMNEAGDILADTIKTKLKENSEHPDTVDALVEKCNEKKDTPQHTASHLFTCLVDKKVHSH